MRDGLRELDRRSWSYRTSGATNVTRWTGLVMIGLGGGWMVAAVAVLT